MGSLPGPRLSVARLGDVSSQSHCCKTTHGVIYAIAHLTHTFFKSHHNNMIEDECPEATPRGNSPSGKRSSSTCGTYRALLGFLMWLIYFSLTTLQYTKLTEGRHCIAMLGHFCGTKNTRLVGVACLALLFLPIFTAPGFAPAAGGG